MIDIKQIKQNIPKISAHQRYDPKVEFKTLPQKIWYIRNLLEKYYILFSNIHYNDLSFHTASMGEKLKDLFNRFIKKDNGTQPDILIFLLSKLLVLKLEYINSNPSVKLKRTRKMLPLHKIDLLDNACMRWLAKQSGKNIKDKIGIRQKVLGVKRYLSTDTTENRVLFKLIKKLKYYILISLQEDYDSDTDNYKLIEKMNSVMVRIEKNELFSEVEKSAKLVVNRPNNMLLRHKYYRHIWNAFRFFAQEEDRIDIDYKYPNKIWYEFVLLIINSIINNKYRNYLLETGSYVSLNRQDNGDRISQNKIYWNFNLDDNRYIIESEPLSKDDTIKISLYNLDKEGNSKEFEICLKTSIYVDNIESEAENEEVDIYGKLEFSDSKQSEDIFFQEINNENTGKLFKTIKKYIDILFESYNIEVKEKNDNDSIPDDKKIDGSILRLGNEKYDISFISDEKYFKYSIPFSISYNNDWGIEKKSNRDSQEYFIYNRESYKSGIGRAWLDNIGTYYNGYDIWEELHNRNINPIGLTENMINSFIEEKEFSKNHNIYVSVSERLDFYEMELFQRLIPSGYKKKWIVYRPMALALYYREMEKNLKINEFYLFIDIDDPFLDMALIYTDEIEHNEEHNHPYRIEFVRYPSIPAKCDDRLYVYKRFVKDIIEQKLSNTYFDKELVLEIIERELGFIKFLQKCGKNGISIKVPSKIELKFAGWKNIFFDKEIYLNVLDNIVNEIKSYIHNYIEKYLKSGMEDFRKPDKWIIGGEFIELPSVYEKIYSMNQSIYVFEEPGRAVIEGLYIFHKCQNNYRTPAPTWKEYLPKLYITLYDGKEYSLFNNDKVYRPGEIIHGNDGIETRYDPPSGYQYIKLPLERKMENKDDDIKYTAEIRLGNFEKPIKVKLVPKFTLNQEALSVYVIPSDGYSFVPEKVQWGDEDKKENKQNIKITYKEPDPIENFNFLDDVNIEMENLLNHKKPSKQLYNNLLNKIFKKININDILKSMILTSDYDIVWKNGNIKKYEKTIFKMAHNLIGEGKRTSWVKLIKKQPLSQNDCNKIVSMLSFFRNSEIDWYMKYLIKNIDNKNHELLKAAARVIGPCKTKSEKKLFRKIVEIGEKSIPENRIIETWLWAIHTVFLKNNDIIKNTKEKDVEKIFNRIYRQAEFYIEITNVSESSWEVLWHSAASLIRFRNGSDVDIVDVNNEQWKELMRLFHKSRDIVNSLRKCEYKCNELGIKLEPGKTYFDEIIKVLTGERSVYLKPIKEE